MNKKEIRKVIINEANNAFNFGKPDEFDFKVRAYNPVCGDKFELYFKFNGNIIESVHFSGIGCTVSKASSSILLKEIIGFDRDTVLSIVATFLEKFEKNEQLIPASTLIFQDKSKFNGREQCIKLSWIALKEYLEKM